MESRTGEAEQENMKMSPQKLAILEVAQTLFVQRGYEGLSIRDLAEACGLAKATIYHHFRDKEDLLFRVLEHQLHTQHALLMEVAAGDLPPAEKLHAAMQAYYQLLRQRRAGVMWSISAYAQLRERMQAFLQAQMPFGLEPWMRILHQGSEQGTFRPVDVQTAAFSVLAMLNSTFIYQVGLGIEPPGSHPAEYVYDFVAHGLLRAQDQVT